MPEPNPLAEYTNLQLLTEIARRLEPPPPELLEILPLAALEAEVERRLGRQALREQQCLEPSRPYGTIQTPPPGEAGYPAPENENRALPDTPTPAPPPPEQQE